MKQYLKETLFFPGHSACAGCGQNLTVRHIVNALGKNTIIVGATGCLEVTTTKVGESAWGVPYIHSLFENAAAVASGVCVAIKSRKQENKKTRKQNSQNLKDPTIAVLAGDGATFDIGFGIISGMFERNDNVLYVCLDNEGYQNTGNQASGASPLGSATTTAPAGKYSTGVPQIKKNMIAFAVSQGLPYVASSTAAYPKDIEQKIKTALKYKGPKYIQILVPCVPGWGIESNQTVKVARLAALTGFYPVLEIIHGEITKVLKVPEKRPKIEEYLKLQKRYNHLFKTSEGKEIIDELQSICDQNIETYGLCPTCEEHEILTHYKDNF